MKSTDVQLKRRPDGMPTPDDFQLVEVDVPAPGRGEVQVQNLCMSVDPYMRGRMVDRKSYVPPFQIGETLTGGAIGRVIASAHPEYPEGAIVESHFGWREAFTAPEGRALVVADYSQIELRAAAAIAGEPRMIDAYKKGAARAAGQRRP